MQHDQRPDDPGQTGSVAGRSQTEVEQSLDELGFDGQFGARPDADILCFTCHRSFPADSVVTDGARRVEGESDPADMAITVPLTCPLCGARGTLSLQYGPQASIEESDVLAALDLSTSPIHPGP